MKRLPILLIDAFPDKMIGQLQALPGAEVRYEPAWQRAQVLANLPGTRVLVMNSKVKVDAELLDAGPDLKMICRAGVGLDHIDVGLCAQRGVEVVSTPGANADSVGEQTLGMLLSLLHHLPRANQQVKQWRWMREENRGTEIKGKTVGIIGYGNTGSAVGRKLRGFEARILAYDKYKTGYAPEWVKETTLEEIFAEADVLTLHIPLTAETQGWVNEEFFNRLAKPIWLLNLARGPIVPLASLTKALLSGKVRGAALDVLENEDFARLSPEEKSRLQTLFEMDNVIFTPHIGGWSFESLERINNEIVRRVSLLRV